MDFNNLIQTVLIFALPVIFSITIHEAAHGYVARYFGDNTAYMLGRVTLNPVKHIDPIGTIVMPLVLYFATHGAFTFGYAKPVPVNYANMRHPKRDMIWVAAAGPLSNFIQALLWALLLVAFAVAGINEPFFLQMAKAGILVNIIMWAFNLFPLPPLDGGRVLVGLLPRKQAWAVSRIEPWGFFIVMALIAIPPYVISTFWMRPLMDAAYWFISLLMSPFQTLFT